MLLKLGTASIFLFVLGVADAVDCIQGVWKCVGKYRKETCPKLATMQAKAVAGSAVSGHLV